LGTDAFSFTGNTTINAVLNGVGDNIITQGIEVATGLKKSFNWADVAAAGVAAGVVSWVGTEFPQTFQSMSPTMGRLAKGMVGDIAYAATRSLVNGSDFGDNMLQGLPNVLGGMIAGAIDDQRTLAARLEDHNEELSPELQQQIAAAAQKRQQDYLNTPLNAPIYSVEDILASLPPLPTILPDGTVIPAATQEYATTIVGGAGDMGVKLYPDGDSPEVRHQAMMDIYVTPHGYKKLNDRTELLDDSDTFEKYYLKTDEQRKAFEAIHGPVDKTFSEEVYQATGKYPDGSPDTHKMVTASEIFAAGLANKDGSAGYTLFFASRSELNAFRNSDFGKQFREIYGLSNPTDTDGTIARANTTVLFARSVDPGWNATEIPTYNFGPGASKFVANKKDFASVVYWHEISHMMPTDRIGHTDSDEVKAWAYGYKHRGE